MKKLISIMLAFAVLVSTVVLPFSADVTTAYAAAGKYYPYIWEDFEAEQPMGLKWGKYSPNSMAYEKVDGGVNDSNGAMRVTMTGASNCQIKIWTNEPDFGTEYTTGLWLKVETPIKSDAVKLLFYKSQKAQNSEGATETKEKTKSISLAKGETTSDGWTYYSTTYTLAESDLALPTPSTGYSFTGTPEWGIRVLVGGSVGTSDLVTAGTEVRYLLDEFKLNKTEVAGLSETNDRNAVIENKFETASDLTFFGTKKDAAKLVDGGGASVTYAQSDTASNTQFSFTMTGLKWEYNHTYHISYKFKIGNDVKKADGTSATTGTVWLFPDWGVQKGPTSTDVNGTSPAVDEWATVDYYLTINDNTKNSDVFKTNGGGIRFVPDSTRDSKCIGGTFYLDDLRIEDLGGTANFDFENSASFFEAKRNNGRTADNIVGWLSATDGGTAGVTKELVAGRNNQGNAMKVTVASNGGSVYHGIDTENGKAYTISFWAKGESGKKIKLKLDSDVIGTWDLTDGWKEYTATFNGKATLPYISFDVDGNSAGETYYLDDVKLCDGTIDELIHITNAELLSSERATETASVGYTFHNSALAPDAYDKSIIKMYVVDSLGNKGCIGTYKKNDVWTVPAIPDGSTLEFYVMPMDSEGNCAQEVRVYESDRVTVHPESFYWNDTNKTVSAKVTCKEQSQTQNLIAMLALYDADDVLVDVQTEERTVSAQQAATWNIEGEVTAETAYVKLYLWDNDRLTPLEEVVEITRHKQISAVYVDSASGDDANDGLSEATPVKTIYKAQEVVRNNNDYMAGDITVYIKGEHYLDRSLMFGEADSGKNGYTVTYTKWGAEKPILSMGKDFSGFTMHDSSKNIYKIYVGEGVMTRQAYFNDVKGIRARSVAGLKNAEQIDYDYYVSDNTELLSYEYPEELELKFHVHWMDPMAQVDTVEAVDGGKVKITLDPNAWERVKKRVNSYVEWEESNSLQEVLRYPSYLENAYELLDASGEWYMNSHDGYLYYIPRNGENMSNMVLTIPVGEKLITASNINNMVFDNLEFCNTGWIHPSVEGGLESNQNYVDEYYNGISATAPASIEVTHANAVKFTNNDFTRLGMAGLSLLGTVKNCEVIGNELYDIAGGGITLGDVNRSALTPTSGEQYVENNKINNNYIHDIATEYLDSAAITTAWPRYTEICHNEISNLPYSGMHIGRGWESYAETGTDMYQMTIANNYIHEVMNDRLYDGGAIYTLGRQSLDADGEEDTVFGYGSGTYDTSTRSNVNNNYIVNVRNHGEALYPDEGSTGWYFHDNVMDNKDVYVAEWNFDQEEYDNSDTWKWTQIHINTVQYIKFEDNYKTNGTYFKVGATTGIELEDAVVYDNQNPGDTVQNIINSAGIESAYQGNFNLNDAKYFVVRKRDYAIAKGGTEKIDTAVLGRYSATHPVSDYDIKYYVSDGSIISVSDDGTITGLDSGTAWVMIVSTVAGRTQVKQVRVTVS